MKTNSPANSNPAPIPAHNVPSRWNSAVSSTINESAVKSSARRSCTVAAILA